MFKFQQHGDLGNMVCIKDDLNRYWRYCHMVSGSIVVTLNQNVTTSTPLGLMGMTGNATGVHLHLECSTTLAWNCSTFLNPSNILNIPNVTGTIVKYDGITPPTPTPSTSKNSSKWGWFMNIKKVRYNI